MASPPILTVPEEGERLYLYLAVSRSSTSAVLLRNDGTKQRPVYYTSRMMTDSEKRYTKTEKVILALVQAKKKLRHYFEAHPVTVFTTFPIRAILSKPDMSGRMSKWAIELSSFDITYAPRTAMKGQAMADFLLECEPEEEEVEEPAPPWQLHIDGSVNQEGAGVGVDLQTPEGTIIQQSLRLDFPVSNNEAEYEALIHGLKLARELRIHSLQIFCDSQLVVKQMTEEYATKDDRMRAYQEAAQNIMLEIPYCQIIHIPRADNTRADELACSAARGDHNLIRRIPSEVVHEPSTSPALRVLCIPSEPCWIDPIRAYLLEGNLPASKGEARRLRLTAPKYALIHEQLYR